MRYPSAIVLLIQDAGRQRWKPRHSDLAGATVREIVPLPTLDVDEGIEPSSPALERAVPTTVRARR